MAALNTGFPTLIDVAKRMDPDGRLATIAETMSQVNPILEDLPMIEGNLPTGHRGTIRSGLPAVAWRILNYGTLPSKSTTVQVQDTCGMTEAWGVMDEEVYKLNGASDAYRFSEDMAFVEAMSQEMATRFFYGNTEVNPEQILGLAVRYGALSGALNSANVISFSGSGGDNTSLWLITFDPMVFTGIYPKGSQAGLLHENQGRQTLQNTPGTNDGRMMNAYVSHFTQKIGLHLRDWAGIVRICNIDVSDLTAASTAAILTSMIQAHSKIPLRLRKKGRRAWYVNPVVKAQIDRLAMEKTVAQLTTTMLESGVQLTSFWGYPIKECDAIVLSEAAVS